MRLFILCLLSFISLIPAHAGRARVKPGVAIYSNDGRVWVLYQENGNIVPAYCQVPVSHPTEDCFVNEYPLERMNRAAYLAFIRNILGVDQALKIRKAIAQKEKEISQLNIRISTAAGPEIAQRLKEKVDLLQTQLQALRPLGLHQVVEVRFYENILRALPENQKSNFTLIEAEEAETLGEHGIKDPRLSELLLRQLLSRPFSLHSHYESEVDFSPVSQAGMVLAVVASRYRRGAFAELYFQLKDRKSTVAYFSTRKKNVNHWDLPASFEANVEPNRGLVEIDADSLLALGKIKKNEKSLGAYCRIEVVGEQSAKAVSCHTYSEFSFLSSASRLPNGNFLMAGASKEGVWLLEYDARTNQTVRKEKVMGNPFAQGMELAGGPTAYAAENGRVFLIATGGLLHNGRVNAVAASQVIGLNADWKKEWSLDFSENVQTNVRNAAIRKNTLVLVGDALKRASELDRVTPFKENFVTVISSDGLPKEIFNLSTRDVLRFSSVAVDNITLQIAVLANGPERGDRVFVFDESGILLGQDYLHCSKLSNLDGYALAPYGEGFLVAGVGGKDRRLPSRPWSEWAHTYIGPPPTQLQPSLGRIRAWVEPKKQPSSPLAERE